MKAKTTGFVLSWYFILLVCQLLAQNPDQRFGIGLSMASVKMIGGKLDRSTVDQWGGLQLLYHDSQHITFYTRIAYGWVYPKDPDGSQFKPVGVYKTELIPFDVNIVYNLLPQSIVRPFISFGAGFLLWDIRELNEPIDTFSRGKSLNGAKMNASLNSGLGIQLFLSPDYTFQCSIHYNRILKGNEDTIGYGDDGNNGVIELRLGVSYYFGGFKDQDGDGIEDKFDLDPLHPEDFDGFQDKDGLPDPDNDNDGIPDERDKAPNRAEDLDGYQDSDGIPDPDNDGDKIKDVDDKCPNTPEDFDGFEDLDGCPDYDNDKDGIPDSLDQCPNWAEDINGYRDDDGCPDEKPEEKPEEPYKKGQSLVLKGVNFASGSVLLTPESFRVLDEAVKTLKEHPDIEIEIRGYTDNTGSAAANKRLSERRAYAVRFYLIRHGIRADRLRAVGYGEADPIASNLTPEGRAANRRIEFVRTR